MGGGGDGPSREMCTDATAVSCVALTHFFAGRKGQERVGRGALRIPALYVDIPQPPVLLFGVSEGHLQLHRLQSPQAPAFHSHSLLPLYSPTAHFCPLP